MLPYGMMSTVFPGYVYDENRKCYFRVPPTQFRSTLGNSLCESKSFKENETCDKWEGCSVYEMTQSRLLATNSSAYSKRELKQSILPSVQRKEPFEVGYDSMDKHVEQILMDDTGELLATIFSVQPDNYYCGVYLHNSENCYGNLIFLQVCLGTQIQHSMDFSTCNHKQFCVLSALFEITFYTFLSKESYLSDVKRYSRPISCLKLNSANTVTNYHYATGFVKGPIAQIYDNMEKSIVLNGKESITSSIEFSPLDPTLFTGHTNGTCLLWDLRCHSKPSMILKEGKRSPMCPSVVKIHSLANSYNVILNSLFSNLQLWDLRARKNVLEYHCHVSGYRKSTSFMDNLQSFLGAVGTDGVVRYWSVESGKLLYYFKPQTQSQPVVAYTDTLLEKPNTPSLLIADGGSIRVYRN